jgi:hypothetical protein
MQKNTGTRALEAVIFASCALTIRRRLQIPTTVVMQNVKYIFLLEPFETQLIQSFLFRVQCLIFSILVRRYFGTVTHPKVLIGDLWNFRYCNDLKFRLDITGKQCCGTVTIFYGSGSDF